VDAADDVALAALLARAQQGDRPAYEKFLRGAAALLRPFLAKRLGATERVEDVLQETLLAIHRARHSYLPSRPVGPWLYAIGDHRVIDFHRRRRRIERVERSEETPANVVDEPAPSADPPVLEALERLPGKQRRVIELLKLQELSVREVAARVGMSESAVKVTAFRGYEAIRKMMGVRRR
jgi:RNA polymerase sigma-70 factor (ECF subfamily)